MVDSLPPEGAVVCSSDPTRLALPREALGREGKAGHYLAVDENALPSERYRAWLKRRYPRQWTEPPVTPKPEALGNPTPPASEPMSLLSWLRLLDWIAQSNRVCYLQPSSGYLTELFYPLPRGLVYELKRYPTNAFNGPPPTAPEMAENEAFWKRASETGVNPLARLISEAEQPPPGLAGLLMQRAHVTRPLPDSMRVLAHWYSGALNSRGVLLQRQEQWQAATPCFAMALELNPDNLPAQVNLQCNSNRIGGRQLTLVLPQSLAEQFAKFRNVDQVLIADGPFDDPACCFQLGLAYAREKLARQAGQQLERAQALAPKEISPRLALGNLLNLCRMPERALQVAAEIRADPSLQPLDPKVDVDLAFLEAEAWFVKTNRAKAVGILQSLLDSNPGDSALLERIKVAFAMTGSYTNALRLAEQQLQGSPDSIPALMDKALLCLVVGDFSNAVPAYTRVLSLTNSYPALLNRALAYLQTTQWNRAEADYQKALSASPKSSEPYYGLSEVASRRGDTNGAKTYYLSGVSNALLVVEEQLQRTPGSVPALLDKGALLLRAGAFSNAIPLFTRVLSLTNSYPARLNRALAYLETSQWDRAQADYQDMLRRFPAAYQPYYGLAEVAVKQRNTNAAIHYYQQYLSKAPTNQVEFRKVSERLKSLQPRTP
jgi:tetratricopeptide (TPR) repeat protein